MPLDESVPTDAGRGLSAAEVAERVADGRTNAYRQDASRSAGSILRANALTLFNGIIAACFLVLLLLGRWQDALFGLSALANTIIGSVQEFRAKAALDRLAVLHAPNARVVRDGSQSQISVADVVLDDILALRAGDQVPADAVVVTGGHLQLDESLLTGESDPVDKSPGDEVLSGSVVVGGEGLARVERVGAASFANRLSAEAKKFSLVASELRSSIDRVLRWVTWVVGPIALLVFNAQVIALGGWADTVSSGSWRQAAVNTIAAVVAMIPLGLVLMTSIAFAVGAVKLARQQVLAQELAAVEGLARVDLICLDKTGTLTEGDIEFDAEYPLGDGPDGWREVLAWYGADPDANATARCLAVPYSRPVAGGPTGRIPFSSARKWSAVSFGAEAPGSWVLGGPEMVFPDNRLADRTAQLAASGRRTLVLAHSPRPLPDEERLPADLEPVAVLTFRERIRSDAAETLQYFADQGVAVRVISGDNPQTVAAIARQVGLDAPQGFDARALPDDPVELAEVVERNTVFGRVTPDQKKAIVVALQSSGHTVAMTGDGVNDALAIKQADIGIAMESGAAATKAVARIVLLDGRFSHLPSVVSEGRQVIANIERVSMLFLTKTAYATALAVLFGAFVLQFPFLPRQLSVIDGLTIGLPSFFLALMPNARRYIPGFLVRSLSFAVPAGAVIALTLLVYSWSATSFGIGQPELRTGSTLILTIVGLWVLTVLSRPIDGWKVIIIGSMMVGLILVYSVPIARDFLQLTEVSAATALLVLVFSAACVGLIEIVRFVHRRFVHRHTAAHAPPSVGSAVVDGRVRPPAELIGAVVICYIAGVAEILAGILLLFVRYGDGLDALERLVITVVGAITILLGLLVISLGSGLTRGRREARVLLTVLFAASAALSVVVLLTDGAVTAFRLLDLAISVAVIVVLWTGRAARFFRRSGSPGRRAPTAG
ncbi:HAD-IC family P-type ATPase [Leifsonia virtsii]|uniref:HAD-IC family P-type ATPase n=1 Tax=Leifsonia virtsii TaxID=3035915 RepID=A0ABT8IXG2_9MICO|nr:HAD-IC family P-type ATPase [Leifsonia virtsii]MDN4596714.1 HAD-IC family P-type ATPase [Leifsonia virtsii]